MKPLLLAAVKALAQPADEQAAALNEFAVLLDAMSGEEREGLWTRKALDGPEWHLVRQAARRALATDRV